MREIPAAHADFERWWGGWSQIRGTNHRQQAFAIWLATVKQAHLPDVYECTRSYLASLESPAKGYNPENFLREQVRDSFQARWPPPKKRLSFTEERKARTSQEFDERMREDLERYAEREQRKIQ